MRKNNTLMSIAMCALVTFSLAYNVAAEQKKLQASVVYGRWAATHTTECQKKIDGIHIGKASYKAYVDGELYIDREIIEIALEKIEKMNFVKVATRSRKAGNTHIEFFEIVDSDKISMRYFAIYGKDRKLKDEKEYNPGAELVRCS